MATPEARPSIDRIREPSLFIKLPEIVLLLIAIITYSVNNGSPAYVASVLVPSLLNAIVFLTVYLLGYDQLRQTPVELALYSYNVLGLFISSILLMSRSTSSLIASGVFCLLLTFIYCAEVYFSYTSLVNRPPISSNTESAPEARQQPAVISVPDPVAYPSVALPRVDMTMSLPTLSAADAVDLGVGTAHTVGAHHTNPVYPTTMNYPPHPLPDTTQPHIHGGPAP